MSAFLAALALAAGAFITEDGAGLAAGSLIAQGLVHPLAAGLGVFAGIWIGDLVLFVIGRNLRPLARRWAWARHRLEDPRVARAAQWLDQRTWQVMAVTRVLPGSRLPTYLAAGLVGMSTRRFMWWTAIACLLWTPLLLLLGAGGAGLASVLLPHWPPWAVAGVAFASLIVLVIVLGWLLRWWARSGLRRRLHHEWWPTWMLYVPILPIGVWLALRHRSLRAPPVSNPALPDSGLVGDSKSALLARLTAAPVIPWCLLPALPAAQRLARLERWMQRTGQTWPLILKPDSGERGAGVRLVADRTTALTWLADHPVRAIAQVFHPGPVEIGIFYARVPGRPGSILAITDKVFPIITGDGQRTLAELITGHQRFRLQQAVYLRRLGATAERVPAAGETVSLGLAGNHCQGCLFRDGSDLITPELIRAVDGWMVGCKGVNFGRFDVRAASREAIRSGSGLGVIELNGLTSEPTNLYDPERSLFYAWGQLVRTWSRSWPIGVAEMRRGARPPSLIGCWRRIRAGVARHALRDRSSG